MLEESRETIVDEAEKVLLKKVKEEDIRCVMFVLRTLGRHRGYRSGSGYAAEETNKSGLDFPERTRYLEEFELTPKKGVKKSNKRQSGDETKGRRLQSVS